MSSNCKRLLHLLILHGAAIAEIVFSPPYYQKFSNRSSTKVVRDQSSRFEK